MEKIKNISFFYFSTSDRIFFIKRLSFLIKAEVSLLESLTILRDQTKSKVLARRLNTIVADVSEGQTLSRSLTKSSLMFSELALNIIAFGESTGMLQQNLEYLAIEMKKKQALSRKILSACIYPLIVSVATLGIALFLLVYLFPKIIPVLRSLHVTLPLSTQVIISLSTFVTHFGYWIITTAIFSFIFFFIGFKKSIRVRRYWHQFILRIPVVGTVTKKYTLANSTRILGLLLQSEVSLSEAMPIVEKTTSNEIYRIEFSRIASAVNRGEKISFYCAKQRHLFPDMMTDIIAVGEKSGNLSRSLVYISDHYEKEVEEFTQNISSLIEPILMVVMGIMVGFVAISIITPIYGITQNLHP